MLFKTAALFVLPLLSLAAPSRRDECVKTDQVLISADVLEAAGIAIEGELLQAAAIKSANDAEAGIDVEARQFTSSTRNDLRSARAGSGCQPVIYIHARGTTESGNLGTLGPRVASALEDEFGGGRFSRDTGVLVQGVGGGYSATLAGNSAPRGASRAGIAEMVSLFQEANTKCPDSVIVASGYSQGAALAAAAIEDTSAAIREKIVGAVLFGYTKNLQNRGRIPNYPADRTLVICNTGDLVCSGTLILAAPHFTYQGAASREAPRFLIDRVNAAR